MLKSYVDNIGGYEWRLTSAIAGITLKNTNSQRREVDIMVTITIRFFRFEISITIEKITAVVGAVAVILHNFIG